MSWFGFRFAICPCHGCRHIIFAGSPISIGAVTRRRDRCFLRAAFNREPDQALADCNEALRLYADDASVYSSRALAYYRKQDYARALADCDTALAKGGDRATALYVRGLTKIAMGNRKEGDEDIAQARLFGAPQVDDEEKSSAYGWRSFLHYQKGDYRRAIADASKSVELHWEAPMGYYVRGKAKLKLGDTSGDADIAKARSLSGRIEEFLNGIGIRP